MFLDLIEEPWQAISQGISRSDFSNQNPALETDGSQDLRVICSADMPPWFRLHSNRLPAASFPYRSHGDILRAYYVPTPCKEDQPEEMKTMLGVGDAVFPLLQKNTIPRFGKNSAIDSLEALANHWIEWTVHIFQECCQQNENTPGFEKFAGNIRTTWKIIASKVADDRADEAKVSLIVKLASEKKLKSALLSISRNPRKILERVRENIKVSRIQQMDGACIREYARRPGYNIATKAGPRQELLALKRLENADILENQLTLWVLLAIEKVSRRYIRSNSDFKFSERVKQVVRFAFESVQMQKAPALEGVSAVGLIHPIQPNYSLQLERRYQEIYHAYQKLRHEQKVIDDAWEWQRVLWGCSARTILYSLLSSLKGQSDDPMTLYYTEAAYLREEGICGRWFSKGNAPGPFYDKKDHQYYLIDSWDIEASDEWLDCREFFPGAHNIGLLGCDAVLYGLQTQKIMLIWFAYGTCCTKNFFEQRLKSCQDSLACYCQALRRQHAQPAKIEGLIISNAFGWNDRENLRLTIPSAQGPKINMLLCPERYRPFHEKLLNNLKAILGEFLI